LNIHHLDIADALPALDAHIGPGDILRRLVHQMDLENALIVFAHLKVINAIEVRLALRIRMPSDGQAAPGIIKTLF
jgi:hypothetical protein